MEAIGLPQDNKSENLGGNTMRKYAEKLVNATNDKVVGNHSVYFYKHLHVCFRDGKTGNWNYVIRGRNHKEFLLSREQKNLSCERP